MADTNSFPEFNALSLSEVRALLRMAYNVYDNLKPEAQPDLKARMTALEARRDRLEATRRRIKAIQQVRS